MTKQTTLDGESLALLAGLPYGYQTQHGIMIRGKAEEVLHTSQAKILNGSVNLVFTSPPFPLNRKKRYDNLQGSAYLEWLTAFAPIIADTLAVDGSVVLELGNAWEPGEPVMSTLAIEALLAFRKAGDFHLCQQFVCHNPARLPSPAQWVNIDRCRVTDSYTNVWWMSRVTRPKANNRNVLQEYSASMNHLLKTQKYNSGKRPSEHNIGAKSFLQNNGGSIPSNVLRFTNTSSSDPYLRHCKKEVIRPHPARMPIGLPQFFIKFLTDPSDIVLDPFGGSNTTGAAAEELGRRWVSIEPQEDYIEGSRGRFPGLA